MINRYLEWAKVENSKCSICTKSDTFSYCCISISSDNLTIALKSFSTNKSRFCSLCNQRSLNTTIEINANYIFVEWLLTTGQDKLIKLGNIPFQIELTSAIYRLAGATEGSGASVDDPSYVGHFVAYVKRRNGKWEIYNDLKEKVESQCSPEKVVRCTMLVYVTL